MIVAVRPTDVGDGLLTFAQHAHPGCAKSGILKVTRAELEARRAARGDADGDRESGSDVQVAATVLETKRGAYAALLVSHTDQLIAPGGRERTDLFTTGMLTRGWHLVGSLDYPPEPAPPGWAVRFTHDDGHAAAPGLVEIIDPEFGVVVNATVQPARLWRPAVVHSGHTAVFMGTGFLTDWLTRGRAVVRQAARAGNLVGVVMPVLLDGPNNTL